MVIDLRPRRVSWLRMMIKSREASSVWEERDVSYGSSEPCFGSGEVSGSAFKFTNLLTFETLGNYSAQKYTMFLNSPPKQCFKTYFSTPNRSDTITPVGAQKKWNCLPTTPFRFLNLYLNLIL